MTSLGPDLRQQPQALNEPTTLQIPYYPPPRAPKRRLSVSEINTIIIGVTVALCVAIIAIGVTAAANRPTTGSWAGGQSNGNNVPAATAAQPQATWPALVPADVALTVKTLSKKCFGSAGRLVTFTIMVTYNGPAVEPNSTWDVTYEVKGGQEPQINTLQLMFNDTGIHGSYETDHSEIIETSSSKAKLTAVVTDVSRG